MANVCIPFSCNKIMTICFEFTVIYYVNGLLVNDRDRVLMIKELYDTYMDQYNQMSFEVCTCRDLINLVYSNWTEVHRY